MVNTVPIDSATTTSLAEGNGCVLVLANSGDKEFFSYLPACVLSALDHWGIPYQILDLEHSDLSSDQCHATSCILIAQPHMGKSLAGERASILRNSVINGTGLVNLDHDLLTYDAPLRDLFQASASSQSVLRSSIRSINVSHFITSLRDTYSVLKLIKPIEVTPIWSLKFRNPERCLLQTEDGLPVLYVINVGAGRVVQYTTHIHLWTDEVLGHVGGLDDVFWRSIVWASRKPFIMYALPPFVTALIDDCSSSYDHFGYIDVFNEYGYLPHLEVFLQDINRVRHESIGLDSKVLRGKYNSGLVDVAAHAFTYDKHIYYDHLAKKPFPIGQLRRNFKFFDQCFSNWEIKPSRFLIAHFGEVGKNALSFLLERGITYYGAINPFGLPWFSDDRYHKKWKPNPYGQRGFVIDNMPGHPEFFAIKSQLEPRDYTHEPRVDADALWGNTIFWNENKTNDIETAAQQAARQIKMGLSSLFFGCFYTHEQRIAVLSKEELGSLLSELHNLLAKYEIYNISIESIADYAQCRHHSRISIINLTENGDHIKCSMRGRTWMTTFLQVFTNTDSGINQSFVDVPPFTDWVTLTV